MFFFVYLLTRFFYFFLILINILFLSFSEYSKAGVGADAEEAVFSLEVSLILFITK